jgi:thiamine biosynthesis lipoprotein
MQRVRYLRPRLNTFLAAALLMLLVACSAPEPTRQEAYVFGTRIEVRLAGPEGTNGREAVAAVLREFDRLHRTYHVWQESELSTLNAAIAAGKPHEVSAELAAFIATAQQLSAAGDHLFDPGIGRLISLWGFQTDDIQPHLPPPDELKALIAQHPSIANLTLDKRRVSSSNRAVALDFGGYLKGVALDRAAAILKAHGVQHALINIGGNIMALGNREGRTDGKAWRVGIQHPRAAKVGNVPLASLELRDGEAIGTSGDYHRFFEVDGKRYCHLIDPRSGIPHDATQSLTILIPPAADAGTRSDALSKPIFIAGERWLDMARQLGLDNVLKVGADGTAYVTPTMKARLTIEAPDVRLELR